MSNLQYGFDTQHIIMKALVLEDWKNVCTSS